MSYRFLPLLLIFAQGCAWFSTKNGIPEEMNTAPKVAHKYENPKSGNREPGSLWSEESKWNTVYNSFSGRSVGDRLTLKVNENFKDRILMAMNGNKKIELPKSPADAKSQSKDDKKETREPASVGLSNPDKDDTSIAEATILEILPNGGYRVGVNRAFKVGRENPYVVMEGLVKEKEIGPDDGFASDALTNIKLETFNEQKHSFQKEEKPTPEKENTK